MKQDSPMLWLNFETLISSLHPFPRSQCSIKGPKFPGLDGQGIQLLEKLWPW